MSQHRGFDTANLDLDIEEGKVRVSGEDVFQTCQCVALGRAGGCNLDAAMPGRGEGRVVAQHHLALGITADVEFKPFTAMIQGKVEGAQAVLGGGGAARATMAQ